jgi:hypothetical protein
MADPPTARRAGALQKADWVAALEPAEAEALQSLEDAYPLPVVQAWRRQAWTQLREETESREAAAEATKGQSWFSFGGSKSKGLSEAQVAMGRGGGYAGGGGGG